jgi:hypothetical protein
MNSPADKIRADLAAKVRMLPLTRKERLIDDAARVGLHVRTWSPGDGVTRYRFFANAHNSYFGPEHGIATVLGIAAAERWIAAYMAGRAAQVSP